MINNDFLDQITETNEYDFYSADIEGAEDDCIILNPINEALTPDEILKKLRKDGWSTAGRSLQRIQSEIDPRFIHHSEHLKKLIDGGIKDGKPFPGGGGLRWGGLEIKDGNGLLRVMGSFEYSDEQDIYQQVIHFANFKKIVKAKGLTWPQKAAMLMKDRLKIHCDCPAFRYFHAYTATKKGFGLYPELRPSKITNKEKRGGICKHLHLVLQYLPAQVQKIASELKNHYEKKIIVKEELLLEGQNEDRAKLLLQKNNKEEYYPKLFEITYGKSKSNKHLPILTKYFLSGISLELIKSYFDRFIVNNKINQKPIDNMSFEEFEQLVDSSESSLDIKIKTIDDKPIFENDDVKIYLGDSKEKCIKYGQGRKYGFCISRLDASNLYHGYRGREATFYFVYFKNKEAQAQAPSDLIVIHAYKNQFQLNYAIPNRDFTKSKQEIIKEFPVLKNIFDQVFVHKEHSAQEQDLYKRIDKANGIDELKTLEDQLIYIELGHDVDYLQFQDLPNKKPILQKMIEVGNQDISDSFFSEVEGGEKLKERYWDKIKQRFEIKFEEYYENDLNKLFEDEFERFGTGNFSNHEIKYFLTQYIEEKDISFDERQTDHIFETMVKPRRRNFDICDFIIKSERFTKNEDHLKEIIINQGEYLSGDKGIKYFYHFLSQGLLEVPKTVIGSTLLRVIKNWFSYFGSNTQTYKLYASKDPRLELVSKKLLLMGIEYLNKKDYKGWVTDAFYPSNFDLNMIHMNMSDEINQLIDQYFTTLAQKIAEEIVDWYKNDKEEPYYVMRSLSSIIPQFEFEQESGIHLMIDKMKENKEFEQIYDEYKEK